MSAAAGGKPTVYVPRHLCDELPPEKLAELRDRVRYYVLRTAAPRGFDRAEMEDLVQEGFAWMYRLPSCDYVVGPGGFDTLVILSCLGAWNQLKREVRRRSRLDPEPPPDDLRAEEAEPGLFIVPIDEPNSIIRKRLSELVTEETTLQHNTKVQLLQIINCILNSEEPLYDFDVNGDFYLFSDKIAGLLGLKPNTVSKRSGQLWRLIKRLKDVAS